MTAETTTQLAQRISDVIKPGFGSQPVDFARLLTNIADRTRETFTEDITLYVRPNGDDDNDGRTNTAGGAFETIQKAVDTVIDQLDLAGFKVTIQVADGTYDEWISIIGAPPGNRVDPNFFLYPPNIKLLGNAANPENVLIRPTGNPANYSAITVAGAVGVHITGIDIDMVGLSGYHGCVIASNNAYLLFNGKMNFGTAVGGAYQICADYRANVQLDYDGVYTFSGSAAQGFLAMDQGNITIGSGANVAAATYSTAFLMATSQGRIDIQAAITGTLTGKAYHITENGRLDLDDTIPAGTVTSTIGGGASVGTGTGVIAKVGEPANTNIVAGTFAVFKNTSDNKCYIAVNDGGTIKKVELV